MDIKKIVEQVVAGLVLLALVLLFLYLSIRFQPSSVGAEKRPIFYKEAVGLIGPTQPR